LVAAGATRYRFVIRLRGEESAMEFWNLKQLTYRLDPSGCELNKLNSKLGNRRKARLQ
jgi:hypothetical protein